MGRITHVTLPDLLTRLTHDPLTHCQLRLRLLLTVLSEPLNMTLKPRLHDTSCCETGCQTGLTTGCIVYTNSQPVVSPVWQPVWQPAVLCKQPVTQTTLSTHVGLRMRKFAGRILIKRQSNSCRLSNCTDWLIYCMIFTTDCRQRQR